MALVDHRYCFTVIDVGGYGSNSDGGIFSNSQLGQALEKNSLDLPPRRPLPGAASNPLPHVVVADEAFPLKPNLLRPYPGAILDDQKRLFNYRLSRARRVSENAFGILGSKFRVYQRRLQILPAHVDKVIKATCLLHNFVIKTKRENNQSTSVMPSNHHHPTGLQNFRSRGNRAAQDAAAVRDSFRDYFSSEAGAVSWQREHCFGNAN